MEPLPQARLDQIATDWLLIHDSGQFVKRYCRAIRSYLRALIVNHHDAEDVFQDFMVRVVRHGFLRVSKEGGRFRDYLKTAVRNAARNHLERKPQVESSSRLDHIAAPVAEDGLWLSVWRNALLQRAWHALKRQQRRTPGSLAYTVLRLSVKQGHKTSARLAAHLSRRTGQEIRADAFRKQLSRARRIFARTLVVEVARTLDLQTPELVAEELGTLGMLAHARAYLPPDWRLR